MSSFFAQRKVLVTGGAGFIGSHAVDKLVSLGAQVTILDNFSTGTHDNIVHHGSALTIITGDVTDFDTCMRAAENQELIIHLAAHISVPQSFEDPLACFATNVTGTANILEAARIYNAQCILASSSAVYGNSPGPCKETDITSPTSPYGYSKLLAEQLVQQYAHLFGLNAFSVRFFNVWGERQNPQGQYAAVVAKFRDQLHRNAPLTVFGDGLQTRDFMYVGDVVNAVLELAQQPLTRGRVINIASGASITLLELIEHLKREFPAYCQPLDFQPVRPGDIVNSSADCSLLRSLTAI